jgi:hypothetical protein
MSVTAPNKRARFAGAIHFFTENNIWTEKESDYDDF